MIPRPPRSTLPATRFPYTTLFRSPDLFAESCTDHHLRILVLGRPHCGCDGAYPHASARQREIPQPTRLREPRGKRGAFGFRSGVDHHRGGDRAAHLIAIGSRRQIRSEEHTSELQPLMRTSYAVFCLKKKKHTSKT